MPPATADITGIGPDVIARNTPRHVRPVVTVWVQIRRGLNWVAHAGPDSLGHLDQIIDGPTQVDESGRVCSGYKGQELPRNSRSRGGSSRSGRSRWRGRHGDQLTLVAACRDSLRVIRGHRGIDYQGDLEPVIQEAEDLSQRLGEVWTDGLQAYREMDRTTEQSSTKRDTYRPTESTSIKLSACFRSSSRGCGSSAACPSRAWNRPLTPSVSFDHSFSPEDLSRQRLSVSLSGLSAVLHESDERSR